MTKQEFDAVFDFIFCEHPKPAGAVKAKWQAMFIELSRDEFFAAARQLARTKTYGPPQTSDMAGVLYEMAQRKIPLGLLNHADAALPNDNELTKKAWQRAKLISGSLADKQFASPEELDKAKHWHQVELKRHFRANLISMQERVKELIKAGYEVNQAVLAVTDSTPAIGQGAKVLRLAEKVAERKAV